MLKFVQSEKLNNVVPHDVHALFRADAVNCIEELRKRLSQDGSIETNVMELLLDALAKAPERIAQKKPHPRRSETDTGKKLERIVCFSFPKYLVHIQ